jgi:tripartite-type tricarboxylate transporter receptor subunit TctC
MFVARAAAGAFFAGVLMLGADAALGQDKYPGKLVRIVTATPGSNHDWGARVTAQALAPRIGERVIVDNRGSIAVEHVARDAQPDGYTVLFYGAYCWLQPLLAKVNWDPVADLAPITLAMTSPNVLVVHPSLPVKSVKDLIALAKARPGDLNYSAGGAGSTPHVAAELFKYLAGVNIVRVRYKGSGPAMIGLMTGEVQLMFGALGPTLPLIRQGKARPLAISTPKRSALVPDLPLVADVLPGFSAEAAIGFFVPKKTSPAIVRFLHQEIVPALKGVDPKVLAASGVEIVGNAPEEFAAFIKADMGRMSNMLKSAHFSN